MIETGTKTYNDEGQTLFVQKVKIEKLPRLDFEGGSLKYVTE